MEKRLRMLITLPLWFKGKNISVIFDKKKKKKEKKKKKKNIMK